MIHYVAELYFRTSSSYHVACNRVFIPTPSGQHSEFIKISLSLWLMTSLYDFLTTSSWDLFSSSTTLTHLDSKCVLIALSSVLLSRLKTKISFNLGPAFRVVGSFVQNIMLLFLLSLFRSRRIWFAGRWKPSP